MATDTVFSDLGAQENKICHYFHFFTLCLPWSDGTRCPDLHFFNGELQARFFFPLSLSPLSPSSRGSSVPLHFLSLEYYHLRISGYWYFSWKSFFLAYYSSRLAFCMMRIYIFVSSFPNFDPVSWSMSKSNCSFLTFIQISQETGKVIWYSHLFKYLPQLWWFTETKGLAWSMKPK